jgi:hypothetical protein
MVNFFIFYNLILYYINCLACCGECLMQYLTDKNKCFICNAQIEKTQDITPKEK